MQYIFLFLMYYDMNFLKLKRAIEKYDEDEVIILNKYSKSFYKYKYD